MRPNKNQKHFGNFEGHAFKRQGHSRTFWWRHQSTVCIVENYL